MPHYFFHLRDGGDLYRDLEGSDLPDMTAVRQCGTRLARTLIGVGAMEGAIPLHFQIEVHDRARHVCWALAFKDAVDLDPPLMQLGRIGQRPSSPRYRKASYPADRARIGRR